MDDFSSDVFVNRDDPIPTIVLDGSSPPGPRTPSTSGDHSDSETPSRRKGFRGHLSAFKEKTKIQDQLVEKLLSQVVPLDDTQLPQDDASQEPNTPGADRPNFNLTTMSNNFRRFNARIGVVFVFQARKSGKWKYLSYSASRTRANGSHGCSVRRPTIRYHHDASAGDRPVGTRFFEDVLPPKGWEWSEKKWALDLWSREWVEERIITGVEVETEGERWVYDIYDEQAGEKVGVIEQPTPAKGKEKAKIPQKPSWEEGEDSDGRRGEWRRRRWVRLVKRKNLTETSI
ncbi:peroxin 24 [Daldinia childiae]|uniref:peroxin 24 n=1 Tax=Daldinia childiae TaxID=326645 RepID=UPI0014473DC1|nr:peroxin 24 [Daldinia childiae]KAF3058633.1 peroxin 24 [Daldinia childiae]